MDIETPALVLDLDRLQANVDRMAEAVASAGLGLRPHAKTHKCLEIARLQVESGAVGLTVATLSEAEVFARAGFTDLLVAFPVVPVGAKADRLRRLLDLTEVTLGVDNPTGAASVAEAARGASARVAIEVDSGQHRTGVVPSQVLPLAEHCRALGLRVVGAFTHGGHSYAGPGSPGAAARDEGVALAEAAMRLRDAGFDVEFMSAGSTPTTGTERPSEVTEERPGTYVFNDRQQLALGACDERDLALSIAATVVSAHDDRFVVDAGSKALASDRPEWLAGHGWIPALDATVVKQSEHHGVVTGAARRPPVGEVVHIVPNHACTAVNLFDEYVVTRGGAVVDRWRVAARGHSV
ncbi:MAG TPA: alanine racemase [Nocardioidaceae bacterium]|nr:alanine racemase [Nocardioidaceae bacterium]